MSGANISKIGDYKPRAIGDWIYVWTKDGRRQSHNNAMISAHGKEAVPRSNFGPPQNTTLVYYCPHGYTLDDQGLMNFVTGRLASYDSDAPRRAPRDYKLSKYQGSHNKLNNNYYKEDYGFIQTRMHPAARTERLQQLFTATPEEMEGWHENGGAKRLNDELANLDKMHSEKLRGLKAIPMDIITIRNRKHRGNPPTLWTVVALLERAGFRYGEVHCNHCRGPASGSAQGCWKPAWV
ncbi:MAG: putative adhesin [Pseudomonadota bacterium]